MKLVSFPYQMISARFKMYILSDQKCHKVLIIIALCHLILFFLILYTYLCVFVLTNGTGGNIFMRK